MQICHTNRLASAGHGRTTSTKKETHCSCKVTVQLLDDCGKTSTCQVQKIPAPTHALPVPSRGGVLLLRRDIPFDRMEEVKLNQCPELEWVREQQAQHRSNLSDSHDGTRRRNERTEGAESCRDRVTNVEGTVQK